MIAKVRENTPIVVVHSGYSAETACHCVVTRHSTGASLVNPAPNWLLPKYIAPCGVFSSCFGCLISAKGCSILRPVLLVVIELPENAFSTPHRKHISTCHSEKLTVVVMPNGLKEIKVIHSTRSQRERYSVIVRPPAGQSVRYKAAH